jgi:hypothetical protein
LAGPKSIRCRQIEIADLDQIVTLLTAGFLAQRDREFWARAMRRLSAHEAPPGLPRFGYMIDCDGRAVGVILLIFTLVPADGAQILRCNLSSWYVAEEFRGYAPLLISRALRHKQATYVNFTPAPHTLPILAAQGFAQFCEGRFIAFPLLSRARETAFVAPFSPDMPQGEDLPAPEIALLRAHAADGCISLVCTSGGRRHPFVFALRRKYGVAMVLLGYCRHVAEFTRFAAQIGRYLARRGIGVVVIDANGPIPGLAGIYSPGKPKYFRGAHRPRLGDLAYSERTMFGS